MLNPLEELIEDGIKLQMERRRNELLADQTVRHSSVDEKVEAEQAAAREKHLGAFFAISELFCDRRYEELRDELTDNGPDWLSDRAWEPEVPRAW